MYGLVFDHKFGGKHLKLTYLCGPLYYFNFARERKSLATLATYHFKNDTGNDVRESLSEVDGERRLPSMLPGTFKE
jgi:hypothetical protein